MKKLLTKRLIKNSKRMQVFRDGDVIIQYLRNPQDETDLPAKLQKSLLRFKSIHELRMRYKQRSDIVAMMLELFSDYYKGKERKVHQDINEAEYVFGESVDVSFKYERSFLLEVSKKNIEIAVKQKNSKLLSAAIKTHLEVLGPESDGEDIPDFNNLEGNTYNIVLPSGLAEQLMDLTRSGAVNLSDKIPSNFLNIKTDHIEEANEES